MPALTALTLKQQELERAVAQLAAMPGQDGADRLGQYAEAMRKQVARIADAIDRRLTAAEARRNAVGAIATAHQALMAAITPVIEYESGMLETRTARGGEGTKLAAETAAHLQALRAEGNLLFGLLTAGATVQRKEQLAPIRDGMLSAEARIAGSLEALERRPEMADIVGRFGALAALGKGDDSVFNLSTRELDAAAEAQRLLIDNRSLAARGSFDVTIPETGHDEITEMSTALKIMCEALERAYGRLTATNAGLGRDLFRLAQAIDSAGRQSRSMTPRAASLPATAVSTTSILSTISRPARLSA